MGAPPRFEPPTRAEREVLLAEASQLLGRVGQLEAFLETGHLPDALISGGHTLSLREATSTWWDRRALTLYRPTNQEAARAAAWHDYCAEHGYPAGDDLGQAEGYPPPPSTAARGVWVGLTWRVIRSELAARAAGGEQLALFDLAG